MSSHKLELHRLIPLFYEEAVSLLAVVCLANRSLVRDVLK